jgi:signal transduction histidine kinase
VVRGEAGIGKTALLEYLVRSASDLTVLRAVGVESEMELAYAGLHQLCASLLDRLDRLPTPQRQALEIAYGLSAGGAPDRFLVGLAVLSLLSEAGEKRPILCLVDDAQWLDRASALYAEQSIAELRELAHGILPAVLTHGGLRGAFNTFVARLDLPVRIDVPNERFSAEIEATAYFVVAEALTNVVKHSQAGSAEVAASVDDGTLHLEIRDDGIGGADPNGNGLVGMDDRVTALGGCLNIESPPGGGTRLTATVPLRAE